MNAPHFDVLIIGAGLSGIGTACHLQAELPHKTIAVLERRERLGGTWDLFRYPGIRSDSDMYTFGYKFRPWHGREGPRRRRRRSASTSPTPRGVRHRREDPLRPEESSTADWSSPESRWTVTALHEATGETRTYTCNYLISCTGYYNYDAGYLPTFPGVDRFKGRCIHPQHWPEDLDYTGKKVVVIGSGATAVTLVPAMAGDAEHITMLQRSPSYIFSLPALDKISEVLGRFLPAKWVYGFGAQAQHRRPARALPGLPPLADADAPIPALAGPTTASARRRHEPLHAELHAVGRAAVRRAERRSVQGADIR